MLPTQVGTPFFYFLSMSYRLVLFPEWCLFIKTPLGFKILIQFLMSQDGSYHYHRHRIEPEHGIVEFLARHLAAIHEFLLQPRMLQSAHHVSQLIKRRDAQAE